MLEPWAIQASGMNMITLTMFGAAIGVGIAVSAVVTELVLEAIKKLTK
jgi:hypothetical protein